MTSTVPFGGVRRPALLLPLVAAFLLVGCASDAKRILTSRNNYVWHSARYGEQCPGRPDCSERGAMLRRWYTFLGEAEYAVGHGGKFPLQLKSLNDVEKEAKKWQ